MKKKDIAIIPGDGIGQEVIDASLKVLSCLEKKYNRSLECDVFPFGASHYLETGEVLSDKSLDTLKNYKTIFLGAVGSPSVKPGILEKDLLLKIRFRFSQYINLRPVRLYPHIPSPLKKRQHIDYMVVRENTGGLYTNVGGVSDRGTEHEVATQSMVYSYHQVYRCLNYAFQMANKTKRKRLHLVGKSNVLTHVFDLWLRVMGELSEKYPDVRPLYYHVDAMCVHMINDSEQFDVVVTTNMFGDIITDLAAVLQGGMGFACSANINPEKNYPSMFEPIHGSAPDIVGQKKANPIACFLSLLELLKFCEETLMAQALQDAIEKSLTEDFFDKNTDQVTATVLDHVESFS